MQQSLPARRTTWLVPLLACARLMLQRVAAAVGDDVADHFATGKGQIADHVEHLVTYAFVRKAKGVSNGSVGTENQQVA